MPSTKQPRAAIVCTIDRLNPAFLGPYGGTWASTPNFNRLAAQSLVLETAISDSPDLQLVLRSYWQGVHACVPSDRVAGPSVIKQLGTAATQFPHPLTSSPHHSLTRTILLTDDPTVVAHPLAADFAERIELTGLSRDVAAGDVEETQFAESLAAALEVLADLQPPFLLWIHLRGLAAPWDAPHELRETVRGDDDPQPRSDVRVPSLRLAAADDPDLLLGIAQAYAAQVMVVDMGLGALLASIAAHSAREELLLLVTSPRGFPLGEHLRVGAGEGALYSELVHVPLFIRRGDGQGALERDHVLVQPADIAATLAEWFALPQAALSPQSASLLALTTASLPRWPREQTLTVAPGEKATRTLAWHLRSSIAGVELYSKPDDRFEANEIASRCPLIAEELAAALSTCEQALIAGDFTHVPSLLPELVEGLG